MPINHPAYYGESFQVEQAQQLLDRLRQRDGSEQLSCGTNKARARAGTAAPGMFNQTQGPPVNTRCRGAKRVVFRVKYP